jgi:hypothetical protein
MLLMTNDEVGKTLDLAPRAWKILNTAVGIFRAYSCIFGETGPFYVNSKRLLVIFVCIVYVVNK